MKKFFPLLLIVFLFGKNVQAQNAAPIISNLIANINFANNTITLTYDLADLENDDVEITLLVSTDEGITFEETITNVSGDFGFPIATGSDKQITWIAPNLFLDYKIKLVADDLQIVDIQTIVDQVDSNRIWADLTALEGVRHRTAGAAQLENTQMMIEQNFLDHDLEVEIQELPITNYVGKNIIGKLKGKSAAPDVYIIDGHYDSVSTSPGADDNATAVAGVLEAVRVLSNYNFEHSIKFIGFDLEEFNLVGSVSYVSNSIQNQEPLKGVINMEMIGYYDDTPFSQSFPTIFQNAFPDANVLLQADSFRGNFILNAGTTVFTALQDSFYSAAQSYVPELKVINLIATNFVDLPNQALLRSDHASFWFGGRSAIMLTDGAEFRNPNYHTANDVKENLNLNFMTNVVKASIATIAKLAKVRNCTSATVDIISSRNELNCNFKTFPNPVSSELKLNISECGLENIEVEIYDLRGVLILEKNNQQVSGNFVTINLQELKAGIYFLKLKDGNRFFSQKIIVE
jgi:hypothetical protein